MSSSGESATPRSASRSAGDAADSRYARSPGSTAVSRADSTTATSRAPAGPGISMRIAPGRRKASSTRLRPRRSLPFTEPRALPDQDTAAAALAATPGGGRRAVAHATPVARSAAASSGRGRRVGLLLLGPEGPLGVMDLRLHARAVELLLLVLALEGLLPVRERLGHAPAAGEDVAHVVEHDRVVAVLVERPVHRLLGGLEPVEAVERPAQAVLVGAALRVELDRLLHERERLLHPHVAVGVHVAEVVQDRRRVRLDREGLPEDGLGVVVPLLPLENRPQLEERREALLVDRERLAQRLLRLRVAPRPPVVVGHAAEDLALLVRGRLGAHRLDEGGA